MREKLRPRKPIIWLTGQSGVGKTTLVNALKRKIGGIVLDGDEMRETISTDLGFTREDRDTHNLRVARLANSLSRENFVIVSVIAPFRTTRRKIDEILKPIWVYVERKLSIKKERPYEIPQNYHIKVNSDKQTTGEQVGVILKYFLRKNLI